MAWIYISDTEGFNPLLSFRMQRGTVFHLYGTVLRIPIHTANSKQTNKQTKRCFHNENPSFFVMLTSPRKHPMSMCAFLLQTCTLERDEAWRRQRTSQRRRWRSSVRPSAKWVSLRGRGCELSGSLLVSQLPVVK